MGSVSCSPGIRPAARIGAAGAADAARLRSARGIPGGRRHQHRRRIRDLRRLLEHGQYVRDADRHQRPATVPNRRSTKWPLFAYVIHRRFVFRVRGHVVRDLVRFESVYLTTFGIKRRRLACAGRAGPAPHPSASDRRAGHHAAELLRPSALFLPTQRRRRSGRDVAHVKRAAVTAAGDASTPSGEVPITSISVGVIAHRVALHWLAQGKSGMCMATNFSLGRA
jgi:hypothetical protein